jgi:hypothetical protein
MIKTSYTDRFDKTIERPKNPRSFYGHGKNRYAIYPDYWKKQWGPKPLLGHVWADDEFYAVREAYAKGLLTVNFTFGPEAVKVAFKPVTPPSFSNNKGN